NWAFTGSASLPIFQGGFRVHDMNQAKAGLMRLQAQRTLALQQVEQDTRSQMNDISSSRPNIYFTRKAADKAKLNLDIVKEKYAEGKVGILDLLDAQNEYITREQEAALAVYRYISDVLEVQRSMAYFDIDHTPAENEVFLQEAQDYIRNEGRAKWGTESQPMTLEKDLTPFP
ncbi:MAG: TolC family protein, partial [bacterium]|nr:TolC family protein [bacterium]